MKPNFSKISFRLPVAIVAMAVVLAGVITWLGYVSARDMLKHEAGQRIEMALEGRQQAVTQWLRDVENDTLMLRDNPTVSLALQGFRVGWAMLPGDKTGYLKDRYITKNPNPEGRKELLDTAGDGSPWSQAHERFHSFFREFKARRGFYDLFLLDPDGNLLYSVTKEQDFATNMVKGPWGESGLGRAFRSATEKADGTPVFTDFSTYGPSNGAAAAFIAARVNKPDGSILGVIAIQMPVSRLNKVVNAATGLDKSGRIILAGRDGLRRAANKDGTASILDPLADNPMLRAAEAGKTGVMSDVIGEDGRPVIAAFMPIDYLGADWMLIAQEDRSELMAGVIAYRNRALMTMAAAAAIVALLGWLMARSVASPLARIGDTMDRIAGPGLRHRGALHPVAGRGGYNRPQSRRLPPATAGQCEPSARMTVFKSRAFADSAVADDDGRSRSEHHRRQRRRASPMFTRSAELDARSSGRISIPHKLVGQCIDQFHSNPAHQRAHAERPRQPAVAQPMSRSAILRLDIHVCADHRRRRRLCRQHHWNGTTCAKSG